MGRAGGHFAVEARPCMYYSHISIISLTRFIKINGITSLKAYLICNLMRDSSDSLFLNKAPQKHFRLFERSSRRPNRGLITILFSHVSTRIDGFNTRTNTRSNYPPQIALATGHCPCHCHATSHRSLKMLNVIKRNA